MTVRDARPAHINRRLAELFAATEEWQQDANCRGLDPDLFYIGRGGGVGGNRESEAAKTVCRACVVRRECLDYALNAPETHGIWGGLSPKERRRIRMRHYRQEGAA